MSEINPSGVSPTYITKLTDVSMGTTVYAYNQLQARGALDTLEGILQATKKVFAVGEEKSKERLAIQAEVKVLRKYLQLPEHQ